MKKCSICGAEFQIKLLNPTDSQSRIGLCFLCWGSLSLGQQVKVRALPESSRLEVGTVAVGDVGVIIEICRSTPEGIEDEYRVRQVEDPTWTAVLKRNELQRIIEGITRRVDETTSGT